MEKIQKFKKIYRIIMIIMLGIIIFTSSGLKICQADSGVSEIVIEKLSGRILYQNSARQKRAIASTTKIITAISVIENSDVSDVVVVDKSSVGIEGSSIYLREGDRLTVKELLFGLMLRSGNDCADALAKHVSKSIENFAVLMNETAKKAGAVDSNFVNPHGLSAKNHYSTALDLARITAYALKNPLFSEIVSTKKFTTSLDSENQRLFVNKNKMLFNFAGGDGVKTGFTREAGRCLVSSATRNDMQLVCVVLNCPPMFERSSVLLENAFGAFAQEKLISKNVPLGSVTVDGGLLPKPIDLEFYSKNDVIYPLSKTESENIKMEYEIPKTLSFPIKDDEYLGNLNVWLKNELIFSEKLYIINGKANYTFNEAFNGIIERWSLNENQQIFG